MQETTFDCITLDLSLGPHAGIEMLRHLWVIGCKAPIIIISGCDDVTCSETVRVAKSLNLNIWQSIPKPVDLAVLRSWLERLQSRARRSGTRRAIGRSDFPGIGSLRIGKRLQAQRCRVRKAQHDGLARRRRNPVLGRLANDRGAEGVGHDETGIGRKYLARNVDDGGEKQPVAVQPIVHPFWSARKSATEDLISTMMISPSPPSATRSARRPDGSGSSLTTQ